MKNIKFLNLAIVISILILTSCNNGGGENRNVRNDSAATAIKKDTGSSTISTTSPSATTYTVENLPSGVQKLCWLYNFKWIT
jgi:hypothetical protein